MIVFRIENKRKQGCYTAKKCVVDCSGGQKNKPTVYCDYELLSKLELYHTKVDWSVIQKYKFGFYNISQIRKWFKKSELKILMENDFVISMYDILDENCITSKHQVMFKKKRYTKIGECSYKTINKGL